MFVILNLFFNCSLYHNSFFLFVDYETLRTTGVTLAIIMFVAGILIALSKFAFFEISVHCRGYITFT